MAGKDEEHDDEETEDEEKPRTFTQEQIEKISLKARNQARRQRERDILDELGVESLEEAKQKLQAPVTEPKDKADKGKDDSKGDDGEAVASLRKEFESLKTETRSEIADLKITSKVEKALIKAGLSVEAAERARRLVDIPRNATDDDIVEAVEELQNEMPNLFPDSEDTSEGSGSKEGGRDTSSQRQPDSRTPHSNPGSQPRKKSTTPDVKTQARTLLHDRHPRLAQQQKDK